MAVWLIIAVIAASLIASLMLATLTYALRDFSRARLEDALERRNRLHLLDPITEHAGELAFLTALFRLVLNLIVLLSILHLTTTFVSGVWNQYLVALGITAVVSTLFAVTIPHALALHAGEGIIAASAGLMLATRNPLRPLVKMLHAADSLVRRATQPQSSEESAEQREEDIEAEILSVIEEGEKEGIVDEEEKEMITSVIEFGDTTAGEIMTARPDIVALPTNSSLQTICDTIEESGHSRIPLYTENVDHIVGVVYARDLIPFVGHPVTHFDPLTVARKPLEIPETKPLSDLLADFRLQKVHIAIVLDEYGGTRGLVTIEDVLEELVGEISDEHEPREPALFHRIDDTYAEADARMGVYDLNRILGLNIPEEADYETLGGFLSTTLGHIPQAGETLEWPGVRFIVLQAEPQRVVRVRLELLSQPAPAEPAPTAK